MDKTMKIDPLKITTECTPRTLLARHFKDLSVDLPINGGWGYDEENAVIILLGCDDIEEVEDAFIQRRIYAEIMSYYPKLAKTSDISVEILPEKQLHNEDSSKMYDYIEVEITIIPDNDAETMTYTGKYWFDTSELPDWQEQ